MAATACARRTLLSSFSSSSKTFFRSISSPQNPTFPQITRRSLSRSISRLPVELSSAQSLMPLHSMTASALLTSMLSPKPGKWGCLSEGFATPL